MKETVTVRLGSEFADFLRRNSTAEKSQAHIIEEALYQKYKLDLVPGQKEKPGRKPSQSKPRRQ